MDQKNAKYSFVIQLFLLRSSTVKGVCKRFMSWMKFTLKVVFVFTFTNARVRNMDV